MKLVIMRCIIVLLLIITVLLLFLVLKKYYKHPRVRWIYDWHTIVIGSLVAGYVLGFYSFYRWLVGIVTTKDGTRSTAGTGDWNLKTVLIILIFFAVSLLFITFVTYLKRKIRETDVEKNKENKDDDKKKGKDSEKPKTQKEPWPWGKWCLIALFFLLVIWPFIHFGIACVNTANPNNYKATVQEGSISPTSQTPQKRRMIVTEKFSEAMAVENGEGFILFEIIKPADAIIEFVDRKGILRTYELGQRLYFDRDSGWVKIRSKQGEVEVEYWRER